MSAFDEESDSGIMQGFLDQAGDEIKKLTADLEKSADEIRVLKNALYDIAKYDEEPIWRDDRDDAANAMLSIARVALGLEEENQCKE